MPTSLKVMVYFVNASAKTYTVDSIKFRAHFGDADIAGKTAVTRAKSGK
jgi:hypothetical protein